MRRGKAVWIWALAASFGCAGVAQGVILYQDDFESYADQPALDAVWNAGGGQGGAGGVLVPAGSGGTNPTQAMFHNGGAPAIVAINATATDAQPLLLDFDYWDFDLTGGRLTVGMRNGANPLFEFGEYNAMDPDWTNGPAGTDANVAGYGFRTVGMGGPTQTSPNSQGWVEVVPLADQGVGAWHHFQAEIGETYLLARVDLNGDGTYDFSENVPLTNNVNKPHLQLRFGGPSAVSSNAGGAVDNLLLQQIPEPATLALLGIGALALRGRRRAA